MINVLYIWCYGTLRKTRRLTLTFDHVTWKSVRVTYLQRTSALPSLVTFKQRGQKILRRHHLYRDHGQKFDLVLWSCDRINRVTYSLGASTVPSLATFKQRGRNILNRHRLTDRLTGAKQYTPFFKSAWNEIMVMSKK